MIIGNRDDVWRLAAGSAASNTGNWAATAPKITSVRSGASSNPGGFPVFLVDWF